MSRKSLGGEEGFFQLSQAKGRAGGSQRGDPAPGGRRGSRAETGVRRAGTQGAVGRFTDQMQASRGRVCQGEETERKQPHILKQQKELIFTMFYDNLWLI